ncbi:MAG: FAD-dependent oxidoreductase [Burkholderiaceae bacterium]|nr:FAD-dependent oxidoreductase [Burkholderiaceae bacterium]
MSLVVVGAGHAAGRATQALRSQGFDGRITMIGDESYPPYERPALSKELLLRRTTPDSLYLLSIDRWRDLDVDLRLGERVVAIERAAMRVRLSSGTAIPYDLLIIATGARPRRLPAIAVTTEPRYLRTINDAFGLREQLTAGRRLAVVGAGFIGLELAASASALGVRVTVVEAAKRPLERLLPARFAQWLAALHARNGVELLTDQSVTSTAGNDLLLEGGIHVRADCICVGIGVQPNDQLAREAGLEVRDGIVVDESCRSSDPKIHAIGDVARWRHPLTGAELRLESWRNAEDQAMRVAGVIVGAAQQPVEPPWFWTDQYRRNIQMTGWPSDALTLVERGDADVGAYLAYYLDGPIVRGAIGVDCGRELRGAQRLIRAATPVDPAELPAPCPRSPIRAPVD